MKGVQCYELLGGIALKLFFFTSLVLAEPLETFCGTLKLLRTPVEKC